MILKRRFLTVYNQFKITANSLYFEDNYLKDIAASTTATGRKLLYLAKDKTKEYFKDAEIVYGTRLTLIQKMKTVNLLKIVKHSKNQLMGVDVEKYIQQFLKNKYGI